MDKALNNINNALDIYDWLLHGGSDTNLNQIISPLCAYILLRTFMAKKYQMSIRDFIGSTKYGDCIFFGTQYDVCCRILRKLHLIKYGVSGFHDDGTGGQYMITHLGENFVKSQFPHCATTFWIYWLTKVVKKLLGIISVALIIIPWIWSTMNMVTSKSVLDVVLYGIIFVMCPIATIIGTHFLIFCTTYPVKCLHRLRSTTKVNCIRFLYRNSLVNVDQHIINLVESNVFPKNKKHLSLIDKIRQKSHDHD